MSMSLAYLVIDADTGETKYYIRRPWTRERVQHTVVGESLTHQSHADSCDVNNIIRRYERTGELPLARRPPQYGDVTGLQGDLTERHQAAQEIIETSREHVKKRRKERQETLPLETPPAAPPAASPAPVTPPPVAE